MTGRFPRASASMAAVMALTLMAEPAFAHGWGGWRHRDRIDAGDVLTGILVVGGIIAIASAASSSERERDSRRDERRDRDDGYAPPPRTQAYEGGPAIGWSEGGVGAAVDRCMNEISGNGGRDVIEQVSRAGEGWRVRGQTERGQAFSCTVDGSGRIRNISIEGED